VRHRLLGIQKKDSPKRKRVSALVIQPLTEPSGTRSRTVKTSKKPIAGGLDDVEARLLALVRMQERNDELVRELQGGQDGDAASTSGVCCVRVCVYMGVCVCVWVCVCVCVCVCV
jgi:hypothetical protein